MAFQADERAQAIQIGAVLLFATLVILFSVFQAVVVPSENERVEFNDYQDASGDLTELRNAVLSAAASDASRAVTVRTGSRYPARVLFVNPPPPAGRVRTDRTANASLWNVTAVESGSVRAYWDGSRKNFSTSRVVFDPGYNEIDVPPVEAAYGLAFRNASSPVTLAGQALVRGNRITLVTVGGDLSAGGYTAAVTAEPVSAHTRTVTVRNATGGSLTLTVPTPLSPSTWRTTVLAEQFDPPGSPDEPDRYVRAVSPGPRPNTVNLTFEDDATYELRLARVELREREDSPVVADPRPRYLVRTLDPIVEESADSRKRLVVEVRDRFDNPHSNANVTFNVSNGRLEDAEGTVIDTDRETVRTDDRGRAVVWYNATSPGAHRVEAFLGAAVDESLPQEKRTNYRVVASGGSGGGGGGAEGTVFIFLEEISTTAGSNTITFALNSSGDAPLNVTGVQLAHVTEVDGGGGGGSGTFADGPEAITQITLNGVSRSVAANEQLQPAFFNPDPLELQPDDNTLVLTFDQAHSDSGNDQVLLRFHLFLEGGISATYDQIIIF